MTRRILLIAALLALIYMWSPSSFVESISGPLFLDRSEALGSEAIAALSQPYHYLGKGKQAFAFASEDGKWVIKFFNQKYFKLPFWAAVFPSEKTKREKRKKFYLESYRIAWEKLAKETGIAYLHLGPAPAALPTLDATDKSGRRHQIDLNQIPFVLQRKADPFYPALSTLSAEDLDRAIGEFLLLIACRIDQKIADGDHDVEHNFGMLFGKVVQIDPGRLYFEEHLFEPERLRYEWWSATHQFREWLKSRHPDRLSFFERGIETHLQQLDDSHLSQ